MGVKLQYPFINRNLISIKVVLFLFYGGLAVLYTTLTPHMDSIGLNFNESRIILIVAPLISIIGPLIAGPLADRLAARKQEISGKCLRITIAIIIVLAAIAYSVLLSVPSVSRSQSRRPLVSFGCDSNGAIIFQERCSEEKSCYHWNDEKQGSLILTNCSYTCQKPTQFENLYIEWIKGSSVVTPIETSKERNTDEYNDYNEENENGSSERGKRAIEIPQVEPPHLCSKRTNELGEEVIDRCHVYTGDSTFIDVHVTLRSATNQENETHSAEWCNYPLGK